MVYFHTVFSHCTFIGIFKVKTPEFFSSQHRRSVIDPECVHMDVHTFQQDTPSLTTNHHIVTFPNKQERPPCRCVEPVLSIYPFWSNLGIDHNPYMECREPVLSLSQLLDALEKGLDRISRTERYCGEPSAKHWLGLTNHESSTYQRDGRYCTQPGSHTTSRRSSPAL